MSIALNLKKSFELNLAKAGILNVPVLQARAAIDKSGSMEDEFRNGWVDRTVDLFIGAALKFDDNGELDMGFFNNVFVETPTADANDVGRYMKTKGKGQVAFGGTSFAPIIEAYEPMTQTKPKKKAGFFGGLFGKKETPAEPVVTRAYSGIITDGVNDDRHALERQLTSCDGNTFYQFIGIGQGVDSAYLTKLAARFKHVGFVLIENPDAMTTDSFYEAMCNPKFAAWI